jgi:hypothetical protein
MDPELCLAELSSSIEDIAIGSSQESWLAFFPEGYSKIGMQCWDCFLIYVYLISL